MIDLFLVVLVLFIFLSFIDVKVKEVPSFFLTSMILLVLLVNTYDMYYGLAHLYFGVCAFIFAWMLYEMDFIGGMADIKLLVVIGLMITNPLTFLLFMIVTGIVGFSYKIIFRFGFKIKSGLEIPFIPAITIIFLIMWVIGGVA